MPQYMDHFASLRPERAIHEQRPESLDWERLYDELGERVFRMLHRMTADAHLAEDLTHDVFVKVHESRHQFDARGSVVAWVFRIAGNCARDALRRRTTISRRLELYRPPVSSRPAVELRVTLETALAALTPEQRQIVLLHDVDGFSHVEIGEMLGIQPGTSRVRLHRARSELRDALSERSERQNKHAP